MSGTIIWPRPTGSVCAAVYSAGGGGGGGGGLKTECNSLFTPWSWTYWAPTQKDKEVSTTAYTKTNNKDIWSEEEVVEGSQYDNLTDPRPQPEYEIMLKQNVGTQDLFLGLSGKDPSSMCCEAMLVKIKLPDTEATDVFLDIKEKFLDLRTPKYKLGLHLPHPIQSQEGRAQFFSDRKELEVTLLMKRPMDFVNMQ